MTEQQEQEESRFLRFRFMVMQRAPHRAKKKNEFTYFDLADKCIAKMLRTVGSLCQPSLLAVTTDDTRLSRMKRALPDGTLAGRVRDENGTHYVLGHLPRPRLLVCVHAS